MNVTQPTWLAVDLSAVRHNFEQLQAFVATATLCPVVKANAYGHGAVRVAQTLVAAGAQHLAVATIPEAVELREAGVTTPELLLLTPTLGGEVHYQLACQHRLTLSVSSAFELNQLYDFARTQDQTIPLHLQIDTGMKRLGFHWERECNYLLALLAQRPEQVHVSGIFSHFAVSESTDTNFITTQYQRFAPVAEQVEQTLGYSLTKHISASGAIVSSPALHLDMVRPGALVYGLFPSNDLPNPLDLRSAMSLKAQVMFTGHVAVGESVGYDQTWVAERPTKTAIILCGYADGFSTLHSNQSWVSLHGVKCPIIGRVSMDQTIIDVSDVPHVAIGDVVHVIGDAGPSLMELANNSGLGSREIQCLMNTGNRVEKRYL